MSHVHPCEAQSEMRANAGSDEQLACDERRCCKLLPGNVIAGELTSILPKEHKTASKDRIDFATNIQQYIFWSKSSLENIAIFLVSS